ncbi:AGAP012978-PA-like protein [Anopheles sinensis]|uniref:AGAP012978-PA-like protein n=1 Tax=Anopheles sinensis TaxID=74873 RepID=A0A084WPU6_ANOSI|nr:AGAP012978-PA-like protein [Anopheles sinensis]
MYAKRLDYFHYIGYFEANSRGTRDDSSASDEGGDRERDTVTFFLGGCPSTSNLQMSALNTLNTGIITSTTAAAFTGTPTTATATTPTSIGYGSMPAHTNTNNSSSSNLSHLANFSLPAAYTGLPSSSSSLYGGTTPTTPYSPMPSGRDSCVGDSSQSLYTDECQVSSSSSLALTDRIVPPRVKKAPAKLPQTVPSMVGKAPMPPPRKTLSSQRQQKLHDKSSSNNSSKSDINEPFFGML